LKAFCTWWGTEALEACRRTLGGHGFSSYSSLPRLIGDFAVMTTGGGDNIVLAQQTARYLVKALQAAMSGKESLGPSVTYIFSGLNNDLLVESKLKATSVEQLFDIPLLMRAFQYVAIRLIQHAAQHLQAETAAGKDNRAAWNECMTELVDAVKIHTHFYILDSFVEAIQNTDDVAIKRILTKLCYLFALKTIQQNIGNFVEDGYVSNSQIGLIRKAVLILCKEVRQVSASLVDAFNVPDFILNSPLGRKDGDIYQKYWEAVKSSRNGFQVAPYWNTDIKPHVEHQSQSKKEVACNCCGQTPCVCKHGGCR